MNHTLEMLPSSLATCTNSGGKPGARAPGDLDRLPVDTRDDVKRMAAVGCRSADPEPLRRTSDALDGIARLAGEVVGQL